jgi:hypothetical protein
LSFSKKILLFFSVFYLSILLSQQTYAQAPRLYISQNGSTDPTVTNALVCFGETVYVTTEQYNYPTVTVDSLGFQFLRNGVWVYESNLKDTYEPEIPGESENIAADQFNTISYRVIYYLNGSSTPVISNEVTVTIKLDAKAGTILGARYRPYCIGGTALDINTSGSIGGLTWEVSSTSDITGYSTINGATSANLSNQLINTSSSGNFWYRQVAQAGGCTNKSNPVQIFIRPAKVITRTSSAGTDAQAVCINNTITNITYQIANRLPSGVTQVTGLPSGVITSTTNNVLTISGTPTVSGTFSYTVLTRDSCGDVITTGSLLVAPNNTISLTSGVGTDAQTVCINTAISSITYSTTGATGATVVGLPNGVTGIWANNGFTISGTPTQ